MQMEFDSKRFKLIVVKAGTNVLTRPDGALDAQAMERIAGELAALWKSGKGVILVTSGAVASGMARLGIKNRPKEVHLQQACAAVGQSALMNAYEEILSGQGIVAAQVLLTTEDFTIRERHLDMIRTLEELLRARVIPIVNENDVVSHRELAKKDGGRAIFSDNDELSALVASKMHAGLLVLLTDVDGLYPRNPKKGGAGEPIRVVEKITPALELAAGKPGASGRGGMKSKLHAAKLASSSGTWVAIANGRKEGIISSVLSQREGTLFPPLASKLSGREQWIAFASRLSGSVQVNGCASDALLHKGASLLAVGVLSVKGKFEKGDVVEILHESRRIARGRVGCSSSELAAMAGRKSGEIRKMLGKSGEVINRENLVFMEKD